MRKNFPLEENDNSSKLIRFRISIILVCALVLSTMILLAFLYIPGIGNFLQPIPTLIIFTAGIISLLRLPARDNFHNLFEILTIFIIILSLSSSILQEHYYSIVYTLIFAITVLPIIWISKRIPHVIIVKIASICYFVTIALVWLSGYKELMITLDSSSADRYALRYAPFGMHPNLSGFIFSAGAILFGCYSMKFKGIKSISCIVVAIFSVLLVLAASARASLIALSISFLIVSPLFVRHYPTRAKRFLIFIFLVGVPIISLKYHLIYNYFSQLLEIDSNTRGVDSGASGRTDIWASGIDYLGNHLPVLLFGGGIRSANPDIIGFPTESSYINIFLELGIFTGTVIIFLIVGSIFRMYRYSYLNNKHGWASISSTWILCFAIFQSIFNRYLLGFGNILSFYLIFLYAFSWSRISARTIGITPSSDVGRTDKLTRF